MSLFVFLGYLAVGIMLTLPLVRLGQEGRSFFLFCGALALAMSGTALALRALGDRVWHAAGALQLEGSPLALFGLFLAGQLLILVQALRRRSSRAAAAAVALIGLAAVAVDAAHIHAGPAAIPGGAWLHPLNALGSTWLSGSILVAMILGHYYLVMPGASTAPLMVTFKFSFWGLLYRLLLVASVAALWWSGRPPGPLDEAALLTDGMFVAQRVLFGLVLPASLGYFTWKTIAMRSTQSATGILYVVVFLTLVGEALSVYLSLATTIPL